LSLFILACAGLVIASGLFLLLPKKRTGGADQDLERANLEWFRLRQQELAEEGNDALQADARLRLLEDEQGNPAVDADVLSSHAFPAWVLLPLVAIFSAGLYYYLGAAPDVMISRQLQSLDENSTPQQMELLMRTIEQRSEQRPDNLHYVAMLGRYYMAEQDYDRAARFYGELSEVAPEDAQALAYAAQAQYLAAGRELSDAVRLRAEQALAIDPHQRTALGLLGMASYEQGQYRAAIGYWQRLVALESPQSETARMISGVIDSAREKLGESPPGPVVAQVEPSASAGVTVRVVLPEGAVADTGDTVFVLARDATSDSRMPIAVQRLQVGQLPLTLRLDDSNSMAGRKLSDVESMVVLVQVSPDGRPGEASATWLGRAGPLAPSADETPIEITLQPKN
jgi:cytochrome c-type biogenesis protein CcmH